MTVPDEEVEAADRQLEDRLRWLVKEARWHGWTIDRACELSESAASLLGLIERLRAARVRAGNVQKTEG